MIYHLIGFFVHWALLALMLWVASLLFRGMSFVDRRSLWLSALVLGLANAVVRPVLILFTLPLTVLTLGLFLLVVNALVLLLVAQLVEGFKLAGFWTAFFVALFLSVFSLVLGVAVGG